MSETKERIPLRVERLQGGGFIVGEAPFHGDQGRSLDLLFACTTIGEALAFIEGRLDPEVSAREYYCARSPDTRGLLKDCRGCHGDTSKCDAMGGGLHAGSRSTAK